MVYLQGGFKRIKFILLVEDLVEGENNLNRRWL